MLTGRINNLLVIDCDIDGNGKGEDQFKKICNKHGYDPYETYGVQTPSGGRHFYSSYDVNVVIKTIVRPFKDIMPSVDQKANGGYVIAPPSKIGDKSYKDNGKPILPAPNWLIELCKEKGHTNIQKVENNSLKPNYEGNIDPRIREKFEEAINAVRESQDGSRNDTLNKSAFLCGQLVGAELLNESFARDELDVSLHVKMHHF